MELGQRWIVAFKREEDDNSRKVRPKEKALRSKNSLEKQVDTDVFPVKCSLSINTFTAWILFGY